MPYLRGGGGCAAGPAARRVARSGRAARVARAAHVARGAARPRAAVAAGPSSRARNPDQAVARRHGPGPYPLAPRPVQLTTCPRPLHPTSLLDIRLYILLYLT